MQLKNIKLSFADSSDLRYYLQKLALLEGAALPEKMDAPVHSKLADWVDSRQAQGLYFFSRDEAVKNLRMTEIAFKMAVSRLQKTERVQRILGGFYIIVPLEFSSIRVLPADWFVADLMAHIRPYSRKRRSFYSSIHQKG